MASAVAWCVVVLGVGIGVALSIRAVEIMLDESRVLGGRAVRAGLCILALLALALLWRIGAIARADGSVVALLSRDRGASLNSVMSVLTTMGDAVPAFSIATVLALVVHLQGSHRFLPLILPLTVLAELVVQFGFGAVFHDVTVSQVRPGVPLGGAGTVPSGSVARLLSVFLLAALLWRTHSEAGAQRLTALGGSLVVVQSVTRLYLARHLLGDIAAGLLLGVILTVAAVWLLRIAGVRLQPTVASPPSRSRLPARSGGFGAPE